MKRQKETIPGQQKVKARVALGPMSHDMLGSIAHKGWEPRPAERMCQQIFGVHDQQPNWCALIMRRGEPRAPLLHWNGSSARLAHMLISSREHRQPLPQCDWMIPKNTRPPSLPLSPTPSRSLAPGADQALLQHQSCKRCPHKLL